MSDSSAGGSASRGGGPPSPRRFKGITWKKGSQKWFCQAMNPATKEKLYGNYVDTQEEAAQQFAFLTHKIKGAAASAACEIPPTPEEAARLDGMSLEQLLAEWRAAGEKFSRGSSAFRGVSWQKATNKWRMKVRNPTIGKTEESAHDTEEEAARAYDARARVLHGANAKLNFPQPGDPGYAAPAAAAAAAAAAAGASGGAAAAAEPTAAAAGSPTGAAAANPGGGSGGGGGGSGAAGGGGEASGAPPGAAGGSSRGMVPFTPVTYLPHTVPSEAWKRGVAMIDLPPEMDDFPERMFQAQLDKLDPTNPADAPKIERLKASLEWSTGLKRQWEEWTRDGFWKVYPALEDEEEGRGAAGGEGGTGGGDAPSGSGAGGASGSGAGGASGSGAGGASGSGAGGASGSGAGGASGSGAGGASGSGAGGPAGEQASRLEPAASAGTPAVGAEAVVAASAPEQAAAATSEAAAPEPMTIDEQPTAAPAAAAAAAGAELPPQSPEPPAAATAKAAAVGPSEQGPAALAPLLLANLSGSSSDDCGFGDPSAPPDPFDRDWRREFPFTSTGRQWGSMMVTAHDRDSARAQVIATFEAWERRCAARRPARAPFPRYRPPQLPGGGAQGGGGSGGAGASGSGAGGRPQTKKPKPDIFVDFIGREFPTTERCETFFLDEEATARWLPGGRRVLLTRLFPQRPAAVVGPSTAAAQPVRAAAVGAAAAAGPSTAGAGPAVGPSAAGFAAPRRPLLDLSDSGIHTSECLTSDEPSDPDELEQADLRFIWRRQCKRAHAAGRAPPPPPFGLDLSRLTPEDVPGCDPACFGGAGGGNNGGAAGPMVLPSLRLGPGQLRGADALMVPQAPPGGAAAAAGAQPRPPPPRPRTAEAGGGPSGSGAGPSSSAGAATPPPPAASCGAEGSIAAFDAAMMKAYPAVRDVFERAMAADAAAAAAAAAGTNPPQPSGPHPLPAIAAAAGTGPPVPLGHTYCSLQPLVDNTLRALGKEPLPPASPGTAREVYRGLAPLPSERAMPIPPPRLPREARHIDSSSSDYNSGDSATGGAMWQVRERLRATGASEEVLAQMKRPRFDPRLDVRDPPTWPQMPPGGVNTVEGLRSALQWVVDIVKDAEAKGQSDRVTSHQLLRGLKRADPALPIDPDAYFRKPALCIGQNAARRRAALAGDPDPSLPLPPLSAADLKLEALRRAFTSTQAVLRGVVEECAAAATATAPDGSGGPAAGAADDAGGGSSNGGIALDGGGTGVAAGSAGLLREVCDMRAAAGGGGRRCGPFTPADDLAAILLGAVPFAGNLAAANVARATLALPPLSREQALAALAAREDQDAAAAATAAAAAAAGPSSSTAPAPVQPTFFRPALPSGTDERGALAAFDSRLETDAAAAAAAARAAGRLEAAAAADAIAADTAAAAALMEAAGGAAAFGLAGGGPEADVAHIPGVAGSGRRASGPWEGYSYRRSIDAHVAPVVARTAKEVEEMWEAATEELGPGWEAVVAAAPDPLEVLERRGRRRSSGGVGGAEGDEAMGVGSEEEEEEEWGLEDDRRLWRAYVAATAHGPIGGGGGSGVAGPSQASGGRSGAAE